MPSYAEYEELSLRLYRRGAIEPRYARLHEVAAGDPDALVPWDKAHGTFLWDFFPPLFNCLRRERLGRLGDGGKVVCNVHELVRLGTSCAVLSFGVRDDASFELELASRTLCTIHMFDPSIERLPLPKEVPPAVHARLHFHRVGLRGASMPAGHGGGEFDTLGKLLSRVGVRRVHLLKMDIEGNEWEVLQQMSEAGTLAKVDQLLVELHFAQVDTNRVGASSGVRQVFDFFYMAERGGLLPFSWEVNHLLSGVYKLRPACVEYSFRRPLLLSSAQVNAILQVRPSMAKRTASNVSHARTRLDGARGKSRSHRHVRENGRPRAFLIDNSSDSRNTL
ncbi:hypothetical protein AB1Y20_004716 [Prymnesium parvum]|uniref:Methyltransferase domain-containing protein n=1 Tax=Prymnesium parvum TaxID=97485 RepID=A0AB34IYB8_PRYPA